MDENENISTLEFEFYPHCDGYHDIELRFGINPDFTLEEFRDLCKRFALAMGFAESGVEEVFGESC